MRKRFPKRSGRLIQAKPLTDDNSMVYDVIAVNANTREIVVIGQVTAVEEAKVLKEQHSQNGFKYYILENNSVLTEIV